MKVSARNVFEGQVSAIVAGPVNCEVTLALPGGDAVVAVVTQAAAQELGLKVGARAVAIVKAPWVIVASDTSPLRYSARNQWHGTVSNLKTGPINAEVAIALPGGTTVHAVITQEAVHELGLVVGGAASAIVKANAVVLAV